VRAELFPLVVRATTAWCAAYPGFPCLAPGIACWKSAGSNQWPLERHGIAAEQRSPYSMSPCSETRAELHLPYGPDARHLASASCGMVSRSSLDVVAFPVCSFFHHSLPVPVCEARGVMPCRPISDHLTPLTPLPLCHARPTVQSVQSMRTVLSIRSRQRPRLRGIPVDQFSQCHSTHQCHTD
jgi:hypothetical protein